MDRRRQLEAVYDRHAKAIHAFLLGVFRDGDFSQEVIQDLFHKIGTREDLLENARNERSFLLRLAHNQAIDLIRRRTSHERKKDALADSVPSPFAPSPDPDEQAFRNSLTAAMTELPQEQRAVVHLKLWEHMTFDAIAATLDIPQNTAASRYRYGIDKLRTLLRPVYEELK